MMLWGRCAVLFLATACFVEFAGAAAPPRSPALEPGARIQRRLHAGRSLAFHLRVPRACFIRVVVSQEDADVAVVLTSPGGDRMDYDSFDGGPEIVAFAADEAGRYGFEIRPVEIRTVAAHIAITVTESRDLVPADRDRIRAAAVSTETKKLLARGHTTDVLHSVLARDAEALRLWRTVDENEAETATLVRIGDTLHTLGRTEEAIGKYRDALRLANSSHRRLQAEAGNNIAMCQWRLGQTEDARLGLMAALEAWRELGSHFGEAGTSTNLGLLTWQSGELQQAVAYHRRALHLFRTLKHRRGEALALNNLALAYASLNDYSRALDFVGQAAESFRALKNQSATGRALVNIAYIHLLSGNMLEALAAGRRALSLLKTTGDIRGIADAETNLGRALHARKASGGAIPHFASALRYYEKVKDRRGQASAHHHLGVALSATGDSGQAMIHLDRAREIRERVRIPDAAAESLYEMARLERRAGNLVAARQLLHRSLELAESVRTQAGGDYFRTSYAVSKQPYYETYIDLLIEMGLAAQALEVAERAKARALLDLLWEGRGRIHKGVQASWPSRYRQIARRLEFQSSRLARAIDAHEIAAAERQLDEALADLHEFQSDVRAANSPFGSVIATEPLSSTEIQSRLDEGTMLVEFALGQQRSYAWVVTNDTLTAFVLPRRTYIEQPATTFVKLAEQYRVRLQSPAAEAQFAEAARILSRRLLSPFMHRLTARRILIAADGILQYVPFSALPTTNQSGPFFGYSREIVHLPSASVLPLLEKTSRWPPRPWSIAILADPVFDELDPRVRGGQHPVIPRSGRKLARLPFSRREAEFIAKDVAPGQLLKALGFDASKKLVADGRLARFRIVHFSTHAVVDDERPELSRLVLSQVNDKGAAQDGELRLYEIFNLTLPADLVVLSGCRTGLGREVRGEGMIGFQRAFLYAGTPRLLTTLWEVDDEATSEVIRITYDGMRRNLSPAAALAAAQNTVRAKQRWRDPYFWAGFRFTGYWR